MGGSGGYNACHCNDLRVVMSKRKLSRQQQWRVEKIQAERAQRAEKRDARDAEKLSAGEYGPEQPGRVMAHFGRTWKFAMPTAPRYAAICAPTWKGW